MLFINVFCAIALFFLLLTGEDALHSHKVVQQDNASSELVNDYLVSKPQLKATSLFKELNLRETNLTRPFIGEDSALQTANLWGYAKNCYRLLQENRFVPDKRKAISLLLYPYHYFW